MLDLINQIDRTIPFADGGLVTGGIAGRDSVPALLMPGERVLSVPHSRMLESLAANKGGNRQAVEDIADALDDISGPLYKLIAVTGPAGEDRVTGLPRAGPELEEG